MLVLFIKTRNQSDLLSINLAHHFAAGFDHALVADNESDDATRDVLSRFRGAVGAVRIADANGWGSALRTLLERIDDRGDRDSWVAVSDTDEFWWAPASDLRRLLAEVSSDVVAVNSDQKLFLPTELDPVEGPVYCRRTYRSSGNRSPLHTSYVAGKTLYRLGWIRQQTLSNPHWSKAVPHGLVRLPERVVHHYMVDGEDSFVEKVKSFEVWTPDIRRDVSPRPESQAGQNHRPLLRPFKIEWWRIYEDGGEAGLRDYYRREYVIAAARIRMHLDRGELVHDLQFAQFKRANPD